MEKYLRQEVDTIDSVYDLHDERSRRIARSLWADVKTVLGYHRAVNEIKVGLNLVDTSDIESFKLACACGAIISYELTKRKAFAITYFTSDYTEVPYLFLRNNSVNHESTGKTFERNFWKLDRIHRKLTSQRIERGLED